MTLKLLAAACLASRFLGFLSCLHYFCFDVPVVGGARRGHCCPLPQQKVHTWKCLNIGGKTSSANMTGRDYFLLLRSFKSCILLEDLSLSHICCQRWIRQNSHAHRHTITHRTYQRHHRWQTASDAEGGHVVSCCLSVHPSITQFLVPDSHRADNTVCLIPMVTRSLPHQDTARLWIWGDWDIHSVLVLIISPSELTTDIFFWVLIRTVNMTGAHSHMCGCFRHHEAQTTSGKSYRYSSKAREHTGCFICSAIVS